MELAVHGRHVDFQHVLIRETFRAHRAREFRLYAALVPQMLPDAVQRFVRAPALVRTLKPIVDHRELVFIIPPPARRTAAASPHHT